MHTQPSQLLSFTTKASTFTIRLDQSRTESDFRIYHVSDQLKTIKLDTTKGFMPKLYIATI